MGRGEITKHHSSSRPVYHYPLLGRTLKGGCLVTKLSSLSLVGGLSPPFKFLSLFAHASILYLPVGQIKLTSLTATLISPLFSP